jgi:chemotaxis protein CheD
LIEMVNVGVAELKASSNSDTLASFGLGSCVAVAIFDPAKKVGGLAHVMLPESRGKDSTVAPGKFADIAVPRLVKRLIDLGARKGGLRCKIVGGAQMFEIPGARNKSADPACGSSAHIGARNVEAVKQILNELKIPIVGEDTGGSHGRTVKFDTCSGELRITSIYYGTNEI